MSERVGLALSGGGFRAAFFHVGVLARLAETGVLAKVEAISTVSGGSIVGALYYIRLKHLLETTPDGEIGTGGYVALVKDVDERLRGAVRKNIRARILANPLKNAAMLGPKYSRSDRTGDLYDRYLYKGAWEKPLRRRSLGREEQIQLREMLIEPPGTDDFEPWDENAERLEKVPILAINATALNSGHNWRFEATRMGEALPNADGEATAIKAIDKNMRLLPGYFEPDPEKPQPRIPDSQQDFPLALAVAASAAVPGVFHPLAISDLYEGVRVQLVDGGVQDNQGVQALRDLECTRFIISDASGQMKDKPKPLPWIPSVVPRTLGIASDRIRDGQLLDFFNDRSALMHLRKGVLPRTETPLGNQPPAAPEKSARTSFGVDREVQDLLSKIRTDLDFFSDTEAFSLALDGYLMSKEELANKGFDALGGSAHLPAPEWEFDAVRDQIANPSPSYARKLRAGKRKFLRLFWVRPGRAIALGAIELAVAVALIAGIGGEVAEFFGSSWGARALVVVLALTLAPVAWSQLTLLAGRLYGK
jgi:NTE family protein